MSRTCTFVAATLALIASASLGMGKVKPSPSYEKVMQVVNSAELSKDQKIARLKELAGSEETRMIALMQLDRLDPKEAMQTVPAVFRAKDTPRQLKLRLGHFMLKGSRPQREGFPKSFVEEFARYLVKATLDDGEKEFCQKLDGLALTAVGEYAYLASDFQGYKNVDFEPFKDGRVVLVLIRCLYAPDNVYPKDQGELTQGKPGDPRGATRLGSKSQWHWPDWAMSGQSNRSRPSCSSITTSTGGRMRPMPWRGLCITRKTEPRSVRNCWPSRNCSGVVSRLAKD